MKDEQAAKGREMFRKMTTAAERAVSLYHHIDPGFVNHRLCYNIIGPVAVSIFERQRRTGEDHLARLANDHLLTQMVVLAIKEMGVPSLMESLANPYQGIIFASTEEIIGNPDYYDLERPTNRIRLRFPHRHRVFLEYDKKKVTSDTLGSEMYRGSDVAIIGLIAKVDQKNIVARPVIMGSPWVEHSDNAGSGIDPGKLIWLGHNFGEVFPEDIDEFSRLREAPRDVPPEEWQAKMRELPEVEVKEKIARLLGGSAERDWGGEQADHYSSNIHVAGRRMLGAFLLKGPARFKPMTPAMLGKNADQIYRMAGTPAELLVLQHAHDVGPAVRATLRAFAVTPQHPRHYCVLDGRDTYRLLKAYRLL